MGTGQDPLLRNKGSTGTTRKDDKRKILLNDMWENPQKGLMRI